MDTDWDRMRGAFDALREAGYWSRGNQWEGMASLPDDIIIAQKKFVLWHSRQRARAFQDGTLVDPLYLHHFERDAEEVAQILVAHGFNARIGIEGKRLVVVYPEGVMPDLPPDVPGREVQLDLVADGHLRPEGGGYQLVIDDDGGALRLSLPTETAARWFACGFLLEVECGDTSASDEAVR